MTEPDTPPFLLQRFLTAGCLLAAAVCVAVLPFELTPAARLINTAGILLEIGGVFQVVTITWMDRVLQFYSDEERFPYGPPSHVTRQIIAIENPDQPIRSFVRRYLYFDPKGGLAIVLTGLLAQLAATWL